MDILTTNWLWPFENLFMNIIYIAVFIWCIYSIGINLYRAYDARKKIKQYDKELVELNKKINDAQDKIKEALRGSK